VPVVSRYDWLLFLHVLSAFALVAAFVLYSALIAALWNKDVPSEAVRIFRIQRVGDVLVGVGSIGVLVFGIWLAIDVDGYEVWDGWVIAALVLWLIMGALGSRTGKLYNAARDRAVALVRDGSNAPSAELRALVQDRRALWLHVAGIVTVLLLLIDMIFKPGA
jgi:glycerol uptake facilitator-like aquaporin